MQLLRDRSRLAGGLNAISQSTPPSSSVFAACVGAAVSAESAAKQILDACKHGDAEAILSLPAQILEKLHALAPGATADLLGLANRFLPGPGGIGEAKATGHESQTTLSQSSRTANIQQAAQQNNATVAAP